MFHNHHRLPALHQILKETRCLERPRGIINALPLAARGNLFAHPLKVTRVVRAQSQLDARLCARSKLFEEWARKDPIDGLRRKMLEKGWADAAVVESIASGILREIDEAVEWAERQPYPDPSELTRNVYEEPAGFAWSE